MTHPLPPAGGSTAGRQAVGPSCAETRHAADIGRTTLDARTGGIPPAVGRRAPSSCCGRSRGRHRDRPGRGGSSAWSSKNRSMPAGVNLTRILADWSPRSWKRWRVPRGAKTKEPVGASRISSLALKRKWPSNTHHISSSRAWRWSGGPCLGATTFSRSAKLPPLFSVRALMIVGPPTGPAIGVPPPGGTTKAPIPMRQP